MPAKPRHPAKSVAQEPSGRLEIVVHVPQQPVLVFDFGANVDGQGFQSVHFVLQLLRQVVVLLFNELATTAAVRAAGRQRVIVVSSVSPAHPLV